MKWKAGDKFTKMRRAILEFIAQAEVCPSMREIGDAVDLSSSSTVHAHLESLIRNGYLKHEANKPRSLSLTDKARAAIMPEAPARPGIVPCPYCAGRGAL